jgi:hypothetical protein
VSTFFGGELSVPTSSATLVVASADLARRVHLRDISGGPILISYDSTSVLTGVHVADLASDVGVLDFVLPCGQELWAFQASGSAKTLAVLVSAARG